MNYVFCGAHNGLIFALYLKTLGKKITILTYDKEIMQYCNSEKINYIDYERIRPTNPTPRSIYKMLILKKKLKELIKKIDLGKEDEFFLTGNNALAYDSFYLAKELSKKGVCWHKHTDKLFEIYKPPWFKPIFFRGAIMKVLLKIIFDLDIVYYETNKIPRFGVDDSFLKKNNIKEYAPNISFTEMGSEAIKKNKSKSKGFDNLIIDQGPLEEIIKFDSLITFYNKLFKLPIKFAFKKHPDVLRIPPPKEDIIYYDLFKHCEELPTHIPVQLFCNNIRKNVLAVFSASLVTLSQINHLNTISILELMDWHHESYKKEWKKHLIEASNNKILFPKNFEELKEILLS